ncbi:hypothetical protein HK099_005727 [Clydaea vesicula]|uniref:ER membrane protein complex subunit 10 n=1 Tax=Clydaea vesicula TaxID=447962 RepID=A0AAD5Y116_9FUNG|nr:hypothetical protein HK099_005727 [Clydaea vesicula]
MFVKISFIIAILLINLIKSNEIHVYSSLLSNDEVALHTRALIEIKNNEEISYKNLLEVNKKTKKPVEHDQTQFYYVTFKQHNRVFHYAVQICQIVQSNYRENITVHLNSKEKAFNESNFSTPTLKLVKQFKVSRPRSEPLPELKEDGSTPEPEKTFLQKYWYYLIPLAIILVTSGGDDKPGVAAPVAK